jgi:hypothetical protein
MSSDKCSHLCNFPNRLASMEKYNLVFLLYRKDTNNWSIFSFVALTTKVCVEEMQANAEKQFNGSRIKC